MKLSFSAILAIAIVTLMSCKTYACNSAGVVFASAYGTPIVGVQTVFSDGAAFIPEAVTPGFGFFGRRGFTTFGGVGGRRVGVAVAVGGGRRTVIRRNGTAVIRR
jgi:hypothetical protein